MREVTFTDPEGYVRVVILPDGVPDDRAATGMPVGPPNLEALGLPPEVQRRLSNELASRRILTERDARRRPSEITTSIAAAFSVDAMAVMALYAAPSIDDLPPVPLGGVGLPPVEDDAP